MILARSTWKIAALFSLTLFFAGCTATTRVLGPEEATAPPSPLVFFSRLDRAVASAGAGNGAWARVSGFPYLRIDRFLVAVKERLDDEPRKRWWIEQMQALDKGARAAEIASLPHDRLTELAGAAGSPAEPQALIDRMADLSDQWLAADSRQPGFFESVSAAAAVPEEYSTAMRVLGLYPLAALPVVCLTHRAQDKFRAWHATPPEKLPLQGVLTLYAPIRAAVFPTDLFRDLPRDPLGIYRLTETDRMRLAATLAPVIVQDTAAEYDRVGRVVWQKTGFGVNPEIPTVYFYITRAFLKKAPVLQVNYAFWYSGRRGPTSPVIERGPLDGITLRVTLDTEGRPAVVDIMNTCGCYHFFLPRQDQVAGPAPAPWAMDPFIPGWMPPGYPSESLRVRVSSGWHQIEHVDTGPLPAGAETYQLVAYDNLEALARTDGRKESLFTPEGIAKNSERIEPYLLFPMGIPKVGSMRQRGHHALKLVGRAYFDDPWLLDKSLIYRRIE